MREVGLEPTRVASLPPQSSASANSATPACMIRFKILNPGRKEIN
jgi:hypothetical protein